MSTRMLPVADAPLLKGAEARERRVRVVLALVAVLLLAAATLLAARSTGPSPATAGSGGGPVTEIVLDVSGSVGDSSSGFAGKTLARIGRSGGRIGLILFSDSAEEALPPGTPAAQLLPFARSFTPVKKKPLTTPPTGPEHDSNPWHPSFTGGTRISAGLTAGIEALRRDGARGTALLISDLGDAPSDFARVKRLLLRLDEAGIGLKILPLPNALAGDVKWFKRLAGPGGFKQPLPIRTAVRARTGPSSVPLALAAVAALLALVLAAHELAARSLRWGEAA
jgi:hypothetical protein